MQGGNNDHHMLEDAPGCGHKRGESSGDKSPKVDKAEISNIPDECDLRYER